MENSDWVNEEGYIVTTNPKQVDVEVLHEFLAERSYWAQNIPKEVVEKGVKNSLNFSLIAPDNRFIGYAKAITDRSTFAYLSDIYVEEEFRGRGLGKWLMECIMKHPELQNLRMWLLHTKDAHGLYRKYGFEQPKEVEKIMHIHKRAPECYKKKKEE